MTIYQDQSSKKTRLGKNPLINPAYTLKKAEAYQQIGLIS